MVERHPVTDRYLHSCSRCGDELNPNGSPVELNEVYYVIAGDERNPYVADIAVALRHTDETRAVRDYIQEEHSLHAEQANSVLARNGEDYMPTPEDFSSPAEFQNEPDSPISVPEGAYERDENIDPQDVKYDPEVVQVISEEIEIDMPAMILICVDCKRNSDEIEWAGYPLKDSE